MEIRKNSLKMDSNPVVQPITRGNGELPFAGWVQAETGHLSVRHTLIWILTLNRVGLNGCTSKGPFQLMIF